MKKPTDKELQTLMKNLGVSAEEALDIWKCDNGIEDNEEQNELDKKASAVKISRDCGNNRKGTKREVKRTVSDEKTSIFNTIMGAFADMGAQVEKPNQSVSLQIGDKNFTINIVEHRPPKK